METQAAINYNRIADAIAFYKANFKDQPSLERVAEHVHLSPFHFQRMFKEWAGVTPKQFLQYLTLEHAKQVLGSGATLSDAAFEAGLSGTGRLHDLFIKIEGMTPGEYKNGGEELPINYRFADSPFGPLLIASTHKGVCYLAFADEDQAAALDLLKEQFPNARYHAATDAWQEEALAIFSQDWSRPREIKLHLKGTPFQIKVWETLLKVPMGGLTTYSEVAGNIHHPTAVRAVGSAVGANPVAFLIPCHRVIRSDGQSGQYHWGATRKQAIIGWEAARAETRVA
ncbi:MAG TPA: methylated-DNA--[protein]-cysteine S-methyltransferase [Puia sp.]|uniref:methylated-DNA--[protein]-cysteine S-methyltransferase n=1 Tax=Puia sp. TaxID=2045100 RepID=UPI002B9AA7C2|nr:methylated-DNA--[protein]-cysteine S-methyltransferase [Puia sp.]HVU99624.1 methylated-DNA--[protein]-cysteine S-methyltransferase [Puia sp.]